MRERLFEHGLDIAHAYAIDVDLHPLIPRVGILVGNTKALWPIFLAARRDEPDPLDRYVERVFDGTAAVFAHREYDGAFLPFQRLAIASGLAAASPLGMLVHPIYGQWFGLRAIVAIDHAPARSPIAKPCVCTSGCGPPKDDLDWGAWLGVRDACSVGRDYRYSDDQIAYHYTKDTRLLR